VERDEIVRGVGDWEPLREANLFITGGTGFFGKWLLEGLDEAQRVHGLKLRATVLSRDPGRFLQAMPHLRNAPWLSFQAGNITSFQPPHRKFTHLLHGAASSDARDYARDPLAGMRTIVEGTRQVMEAMSHQASLRVLFLSSGAVYGPQPAELTHIPEDFPLPPDTEDRGQAYGQAKRESERIVSAACAALSFPCPIARCFAFAGPHLPLDQHFAFGNFIRDALAGGPIRVGGDGTPMRSYLYASELAVWLWSLLMRGESTTYHVGSDQALSIRDLAQAIAAATDTVVDVAQEAEAGFKPSRYVPAVTRVPEGLGLRQTVDLAASIRRTLAWHRGEMASVKA
jgi:dTDP-glucose 4,6-dehydratase